MPIRILWRQGRNETDANYRNRLNYSRPRGPSSAIGHRLRGVRQSVENRFRMLDHAFPFKRIPADSPQAKLALVCGYALGHNLAMTGLDELAGSAQRAGPQPPVLHPPTRYLNDSQRPTNRGRMTPPAQTSVSFPCGTTNRLRARMGARLGTATSRV